MPRTNTYHHFCPVARSLEVIGEKWSLLIVRDLLRGPTRFSDLERNLGDITPKWLTARLRDLEEAGIVAREREPGRREVWYHLTPKGEHLAPVVDALADWGIRYAMRPPLPGEPFNPDSSTHLQCGYFNRRGFRLPGPRAWRITFPDGRAATLLFDGERWSAGRDSADPDVTIAATHEAWMNFLVARGAARREMLSEMAVEGAPDRVAEFLQAYRIPG